MTAAIDITQIARPEPKKNGNNQYIIPTPDGTPRGHTRATTIAGTIDDRHMLELWQQRMTAWGIARRPDLLALAATHHPTHDRNAYNSVVAKAMAAAEADAKASIGTALHRATEQLDAGTPLDDIPAQFHERLTEYRQALTDHGIEIHVDGIERIVVLDQYRIAGTGDRVPVTLPDGRRLIGDLKTGSLGDYKWLNFSIQLAIYANHDATYDPATDKRGPRIDVDRGEALLIHLPSEGGPCKLYLVDIAAGWDYFLTALDVREHRRVSAREGARLYQPLNPGTGGDTAVGDWLRQRVMTIGAEGAEALADLRNRWPDTVPQPLPATPTTAQVDALAPVLSRVEAIHQIAFGPERPGIEPQQAMNKEQ